MSEVVAVVQVRDSVWVTSSGTTSAVVTLPAYEPQDTILILVGGGNRVTSWSGTWYYSQYATGQEAQGIVIYKVMDTENPETSITINFDGTDPRAILAVSLDNMVELEFPFTHRSGTAGVPVPADAEEIVFEAGRGDVLLTLEFDRNADNLPTLNRGTQLYNDTFASCTAAGWAEEVARGQVVIESLGHPPRTGQYAVVVQAWAWADGGRTTVDHEFEIANVVINADGFGETSWDPVTHTLSAPVNTGIGGRPGIEFDILGDFTELPIAGIRFEQIQSAGRSYLNCAFDRPPPDIPSYFAIDTSTIWQYWGAFNLYSYDARHSLTGAYFNNDQYSTAEVLRRIAYTDTYNHGYGELISTSLTDPMTTTFHIYAYEAPQVILEPLEIDGQLDSTRVRPYIRGA